MNDQRFLDTWKRLAKQGKCDSPGGMEYQRVLSEWKLAGAPEGGIDAFIVARANIQPIGPGREQTN